MLGGATLTELRTALIESELIEEGGASPRVSPTADLGDAAALLQRAGFAMPVADADTITVTYPDALALMHDLRAMGETNALSARRRTSLRRSTLARAVALYGERFGLPDGRIPASFEILFLTGWAPDASQPQPLRPGSATHRLADALGAVEISAGDRAAPPVKAGPLMPKKQSKQIAQHRDQRLVGGRHRVVGEPGRAHPGEALALARQRDPRPLAADIERHQQVKVGIGVRGEGEGSEAARGNVDAEFLAKLADQRRFRGLARVDLAAGKLPQPRHGFAFRALGQQNAPVGVDQHHRRDEDEGRRRVSCGSCH